MNVTVEERLADMGDPQGYMRHSRTEWRVSRYPRIVPPLEGKGRRKGTRRERRTRR